MTLMPLGTESLDKELQEIQKEIYDKDSSEKVISNKISETNPLKLVFKIAKNLLETNPNDEEIYNAKIKLAEELKTYDKVKNEDQIKALVDFLEYLFLIEDKELQNKYKEYKNAAGGVFKLSIDEIRRLHYKQEGKEEGKEEEREQSRLKDVERVLKLLTKKFKDLDEGSNEKIRDLDSDKLNIIIEEILDIESLKDVGKYLA